MGVLNTVVQRVTPKTGQEDHPAYVNFHKNTSTLEVQVSVDLPDPDLLEY